MDINDWDYNWQETYWFKEPIKVEGRDASSRSRRCSTTAPKNPNNPTNPPKAVFFGEQTTNEMLFGFFGVTTEDNKRVRLEAEAAGGEK